MPANTRIAPFLSVRRGSHAIEFYEAAFDAKVLFRIDADDGAVVAQLSVDGAEFWIADESPEHKNFSPESLSGSTTRMLLIVDNPDRVWAQAVAGGATKVCPVAEQHGWRFGRVLDPFGHHWEIGKPLESR
jgi:PhnB protein